MKEYLDSLLSMLKAPFSSLSYLWYIFICLVSVSSDTCPPNAVDELVPTWREAETISTTFTSRVFSHIEGENILV